MSNRPAIKWFLLLSILLSTRAQALDVQLFRPNFDQQGGISVQSTKTMPRLHFDSGAYINWVKNPIEFGLSNDSHTDTLVGWFTTIDLLLGMGITDDLTVGLDMPFNLSSNIEPIGNTLQSASSNIGDLNLYAKYRLHKHNEEKKIIPGVAVVPFMTLPTGDNAVFFGNDKMTGGFKLAMDWIPSDRQNISFNVGPRFRETDTILNLTVGNELLGGLGYNYLIWEKQKLNLSVELVGSTTFSKFMTEEISSPLELLIGLHKPWINDRLLTTFGIGRGGNNGYGAPDIRVFVGAVYLFSAAKPKVDTDNDGITDDHDQCVDQPEDIDGFEDQDGCPDPDNDHDGISDVNDKCPLEAEVINGVEDQDGCPDEGKSRVIVEGTKIVLMDKVFFATGKDIILSKSNDILNQVVLTLKAHPEITLVRIEGHSDSQGPDAFNMDLSQRRANQVREYLINQGIAPERLESQGFGETKPIDTNATPQGRENNRRVEFNIISQAPSAQNQKALKKILPTHETHVAETPVDEAPSAQTSTAEKSTTKVMEAPVVQQTPVQEAIVEKPAEKMIEQPAVEKPPEKLSEKPAVKAQEKAVVQPQAPEPAISTPVIVPETVVEPSVVVAEEPKLSRKERKKLEKAQREQAKAEALAAETPVVETAIVETPVIEKPTTKAIEKPVVEKTPVQEAVVETPIVEKPADNVQEKAIVQPQVQEPALSAPTVVPETVVKLSTEVVEEPKLSRKERKKLEKAQREQAKAEALAAETPVVEKPAVETPAETPVVEKPMTKAIEKPVVEKNPVQEAIVEKPTTKISETPIVETPSVEKPDEKMIEKPVVEKPAVNVQEKAVVQPQVQESTVSTPEVVPEIVVEPNAAVTEEPKLSRKERKKLEKAQREQAKAEKLAAETPVVETSTIETPVVEKPAAKVVEKPITKSQEKVVPPPLVQESTTSTPEVAPETVVASSVPVTEEPKLSRKERKKLEKAQHEQAKAEALAAETPVVEAPSQSTNVITSEKNYVVHAETVENMAEGEKDITYYRIYFLTEKNNILPEYAQVLSDVVKILKNNSKIKKIMVEGHADSRGPEKYNMKLSEERADSVQKYLIKSGISVDRLDTIGYGELSPTYTNETIDGRAHNRRVEFIILDTK